MVNLQVLVLSLIPLFAGPAPHEEGVPIGALSFLGLGAGVSSEFMVGAWKYSDEFFKWGVTDKDKAEVRSVKGRSYMSLKGDGTATMINLFRPAEARWKLTDEGIALYDPRFPDRPSQALPVRKRDGDRIWILLPFTGGASGIGMVRATDEEFEKARAEGAGSLKKRRESSD